MSSRAAFCYFNIASYIITDLVTVSSNPNLILKVVTFYHCLFSIKCMFLIFTSYFYYVLW